MFNRFIYRREWSFRIYRETLSRFSCAASSAARRYWKPYPFSLTSLAVVL
ncbi:hypothetical protein ABLN67_14865 [Mycobacterium tuberculosis]